MKAGTKKTIGTAVKLLALLYVYDRVVAPGAAKLENSVKAKAGA